MFPQSPALFLPAETVTGSRGRLTPAIVNRLWNDLCASARVKGRTPHSARHAMGVHLVKKTGNPRTAQRQLGHRATPRPPCSTCSSPGRRCRRRSMTVREGKGAGFLFFGDFCYSLTVVIRFFLTMKTVTINLDGQLEQQIDALSREEGRDAAAVILDVLAKGLAEVQDRTHAAQVLEEIFARPVPPPFDAMTEEEVMAAVDEEIARARAERRSA
jgi:predicted DNA-binding protein